MQASCRWAIVTKQAPDGRGGPTSNTTPHTAAPLPPTITAGPRLPPWAPTRRATPQGITAGEPGPFWRPSAAGAPSALRRALRSPFAARAATNHYAILHTCRGGLISASATQAARQATVTAAPLAAAAAPAPAAPAGSTAAAIDGLARLPHPSTVHASNLVPALRAALAGLQAAATAPAGSAGREAAAAASPLLRGLLVSRGAAAWPQAWACRYRWECGCHSAAAAPSCCPAWL